MNFTDFHITNQYAPSPYNPRDIRIKVHYPENPFELSRVSGMATDIVSWAESVKLVNYVGPIQRIDLFLNSERANLRVTMYVPDVDRENRIKNVDPRAVSMIDGFISVSNEIVVTYDEQQRPDPHVLNRHLRRALWEVTRHELDENLTVGGMRVFDPHAEPP